MPSDPELLRRYLELRSETAFAELVRGHLNFVYFAALRQLGGDAHRAQEVAQTVFSDLARKAPSLVGRESLTGWLYHSTRFAAAKARRDEVTRRKYEQAANAMSSILRELDPDPEWERLRPVIDDAIEDLPARDREAVLMRFFEGRPFAEIGAAYRLSEDAARMRVERALDKLRTALGRRGVTSTSAALSLAFANQLTASAPAGLQMTVTTVALSNLAASGPAAIIFTMSNLKFAAVGALALAATTTFVVQAGTGAELHGELSALRQANQAILNVRAENLQLAKNVAEIHAHAPDAAELARLAPEAAHLRAQVETASQAISARPNGAPNSARNRVGDLGPVYEFAEVERPPRLRYQTHPKYPTEHRNAPAEVVVDFAVDTDGNVQNVEAVGTAPREFQDAAVKSVALWTFVPGRHQTKPVATHLQVTIVFDPTKGTAVSRDLGPATVRKKPAP
jgi:RNA polymerase sigma factor (sigma-70 family)